MGGCACPLELSEPWRLAAACPPLAACCCAPTTEGSAPCPPPPARQHPPAPPARPLNCTPSPPSSSPPPLSIGSLWSAAAWSCCWRSTASPACPPRLALPTPRTRCWWPSAPSPRGRAPRPPRSSACCARRCCRSEGGRAGGMLPQRAVRVRFGMGPAGSGRLIASCRAHMGPGVPF